MTKTIVLTNKTEEFLNFINNAKRDINTSSSEVNLGLRLVIKTINDINSGTFKFNDDTLFELDIIKQLFGLELDFIEINDLIIDELSIINGVVYGSKNGDDATTTIKAVSDKIDVLMHDIEESISVASGVY